MINRCNRAAAIGFVLLLSLECACGDDNLWARSDSAMVGRSVVGCLSSACHGSDVPDAPIWQRAGKTWFDQDPHAQAYTRLLSVDSANIVSRLVHETLLPSSPAYRQILEEKCVSCHANESAPESQRVLGADCQVCHGNADAWSSEHYSSQRKALGPSRFENSGRMNMESLVDRARVCNSCHIGELDRGGLDREVDHRLMAAGHPPMHFDFEDSLRRYPVHWDTSSETIGPGSSMGFERWRIGKISAAISKLKLLSARADRAKDEKSPTIEWPELTEYNCSDCHHALAHPSRRQSRPAPVITPVIAQWDDWCTASLECALRDTTSSELNDRFLNLKNQIEMIAPDPSLVAINADSLRQWLMSELKNVSSESQTSSEILLSKMKTQLESSSRLRNWESAAQWVMATQVLAEGLGLELLSDAVPLLGIQPMADKTKTWKPNANKDPGILSRFKPDTIENYGNYLQQQLRNRP